MPSHLGRSTLLNTRSLLDTRHLSKDEIHSLFERATRLDSVGAKFGNFFDPREAAGRISKVVCCLFFEPSTRTRMSFQTAAYRLGHQVLTMELSSGSSLSKGETFGDTVMNIAAMKPDVMIVRYGASDELDALLPRLDCPVINAGSGTMAHPTQALLDAYTIHRKFGGVHGQKVLIVGDIKHSRVAQSNFDVLSKMGAEIGICGPDSLLPDSNEWPEVKRFEELDEAIEWASVYMGLRIQLERHDPASLRLKSLNDYHSHFGLSASRLKKLDKNAIILHPGPINHGVEFSHDVMDDPRCRVLEQVANGVLMRASLLSWILDTGSSSTDV